MVLHHSNSQYSRAKIVVENLVVWGPTRILNKYEDLSLPLSLTILPALTLVLVWTNILANLSVLLLPPSYQLVCGRILKLASIVSTHNWESQTCWWWVIMKQKWPESLFLYSYNTCLLGPYLEKIEKSINICGYFLANIHYLSLLLYILGNQMAVFIDSAFIAIGCISNKIPYVKCNIFIVLLLIGYIIMLQNHMMLNMMAI